MRREPIERADVQGEGGKKFHEKMLKGYCQLDQAPISFRLSLTEPVFLPRRMWEGKQKMAGENLRNRAKQPVDETV